MARLLVLGAGFSCHAGLPLGKEIFGLILGEARKSILYENILKKDIDRFLAFKHRTEDVQIREQDIDVEELLSFLDVEHFIRLKGADVYADEGDRSQMVIKNLIATILLSYQRRITPKQWKPYDDLAARLEPGDWVVTFNYDTLVETALEHAGVPYRLVPTRLEEVHLMYGVEKTPETEVVVLKVHGSIDWFDAEFWRRERALFDQYPQPIPDRHPIFSRQNVFKPTPIVHEPYYADSQLRRIRRVTDVGQYLAERNFATQAPLILAPSRHKLLYSDPLKELWFGMNSSGSLMERVAVIGFSLPEHDQYAVQALYALIRNFQHFDARPFVRKQPLRFVDWCPSAAERARLCERYRFVDWSRAKIDGRGFRPAAVNFVMGRRGGARRRAIAGKKR